MSKKVLRIIRKSHSNKYSLSLPLPVADPENFGGGMQKFKRHETLHKIQILV